jgi:hypothetical protein
MAVCNYSDVTAWGLSRQAHVCRHAIIIWGSRGIEWPPIQKCVRLHEFNADGVLLLRKWCWSFLTQDRCFVWTDGETATWLMFMWQPNFILRRKRALPKLVAGYRRFRKQFFFLDDRSINFLRNFGHYILGYISSLPRYMAQFGEGMSQYNDSNETGLGFRRGGGGDMLLFRSESQHGIMGPPSLLLRAVS